MTIVDGERKCTVVGCNRLGKESERRFSKRMDAWVIRRKPLCTKHLQLRKAGIPADKIPYPPYSHPYDDFVLVCPHCSGLSHIKKIRDENS